jgi:hypothetical protein
MEYSTMNSSLTSLNKVPTPKTGIAMFPKLMVTGDIANRFKNHGLPIALSIATYSISCGMSVYGTCGKNTNLEIMSLLTSNIPGGIPNYIECSAIPTPRQPMPNNCQAMFTKD